MTMTRLEFGQWVKEQRLNMGLTQKEIATKIGYTDGQISNIEKGARSASWEFCRKFAKVIGADYLDVERYAGLTGNSIPSKPDTPSPASQKVQDLMASAPPDQQELILKMTELLIGGKGNESAVMGRASPHSHKRKSPSHIMTRTQRIIKPPPQRK